MNTFYNYRDRHVTKVTGRILSLSRKLCYIHFNSIDVVSN